MESKSYNINDLHFEHRLWKSEMKIILGELNVYEEWLASLSQRSQKVEFQKKIEKFQNKFLIQRTHYDKFNDRINAQDSFIESLEKENPKDISETSINDHTHLKEEIDYAYKLYTELKADYKVFYSSVTF